MEQPALLAARGMRVLPKAPCAGAAFLDSREITGESVYFQSLRGRSSAVGDLRWRTIHQGTTAKLGRGIAFPQSGHLPRPIRTLNPS